MSLRRSLQFGVLGVILALIVGRWLAVGYADASWAASVGASATHQWIWTLRSKLAVFAFATASAWCVGNLYLVYRSIGAVHVPRQVGNIEILEAVPRAYLLAGAVGLGLVLAIVIAHDADSWWAARALSGSPVTLNLRDPLLGHDASYYLFRLPWQRTLHTFATMLTVVMVLVVTLLYVAVGAVRRTRNRVRVVGLARTHLAGLLALLAAVLLWGYRLEPAEYVAGVHGVPFDVVLTRVRVPVARLLSALAVVAGLSSLLWIWIERVALTIATWSVLVGASIVGHYIAPAFAAAVRTPDELAFGDADRTREVFEAVAYGVPPNRLPFSPADPAEIAKGLADGPVWDGFAITVALGRTVPLDSFERIGDARLAGFRDPAGRLRPVYLVPREFDLDAAQRDRALSWEAVHRGAFAAWSGVLAVAGDQAGESGMPLYVPDVTRPDALVPAATPTALRDPRVWFAPGLRDFAIVGEEPAGGIPVGGILGRLAFAWVLQSAKVLSPADVPSGAWLLWERDATRRLERFAPFARFGLAYPTVVDGRLYWVASGYVAARGFPGTRQVEWRGDRMRYLRAGLVGVIEAATGATNVYVLRGSDPLTHAWALLVPEILEPADGMPTPLRDQLRYPAELLTVQRGLLTRERPGSQPNAADPTTLREIGRADAPMWWVGPLPTDTVPRLRRLSVVDAGADGIAVLFLDGTVRDGGPVLDVIDLGMWSGTPGPTEAARRLTAADPDDIQISGLVRSVLTDAGVVYFRSLYEAAADDAAPALVGVKASWNGVEASGATLREVAERLERSQPEGGRSARWDEVRRWFGRLDAARRAGDWGAFGEAYDALRQLVNLPADSLP
ncbi:MAG TPA: UPF0182 family protein [Gemmatimonadales bacterium]|jgi:hypothetical protein